MQEEMDNISRKIRSLKNARQRSNTGTKMKNASDYLISRQDMAKKESMSVNIDQQKLPKLKCKEGKQMEKKQDTEQSI